MTWLDYAVLGVIVISIGLGAWRGLVRTAISMAGWVIALVAAWLLAGPFSALVPQQVQAPQLRLSVAFAAIFLGVWLGCAVAGWLLSKIVQAVGLGGIDTALGTVFGGLRAALIVLAAALAAGLTEAPRQPYWQESTSGPLAGRAVTALKPLLPKTLADSLRYH